MAGRGSLWCRNLGLGGVVEVRAAASAVVIEEVHMEFILILSEDPDLVVTEEQRQLAVQRTGEYAMGLVGEGRLKGGAPLHPVTEARKIRTRNAETRVLDGPFAEAKEIIAGWFVIEEESLDEAAKVASGCPNAE